MILMNHLNNKSECVQSKQGKTRRVLSQIALNEYFSLSLYFIRGFSILKAS